MTSFSQLRCDTLSAGSSVLVRDPFTLTQASLSPECVQGLFSKINEQL